MKPLSTASKDNNIIVIESGCNMDGSKKGCEQLRVHNQIFEVMILAPKYAMVSDLFTSSMTLKVMSQ